MIISMSGYGFISNQYQGLTYNIFFKSLNNKYLNFSINLPNEINFLETEIIKILKQKFRRGRISLNISIDFNPEFNMNRINYKAINYYLSVFDTISKKLGIDKASINITDLFSLNGVLVPFKYNNNKFISQIKNDIKSVVDKTIIMKTEEGKNIEKYLKKDLLKISQLLKKIDNLKYIEENVARREFSEFLSFIKKSEVLSEKDLINLNDLYINQRKGIKEEINRLKSHICLAMKEINKTSLSSGKKIEFLVNEIHREVHTILSKFRNKKIINIIAKMMEHIDNMKEQVQNIE